MQVFLGFFSVVEITLCFFFHFVLFGLGHTFHLQLVHCSLIVFHAALHNSSRSMLDLSGTIPTGN